jgi:TetR/AcrR family transcriptional repressor of nem operon
VIAQPVTPPAPETKERILRTAFQLFHEQGFHATGVATIVREAGVNPGSLYHFFESKDDLLLNVLEFAITYLGPAVMEPVEAHTPDPIARIFALLDRYRDGMLQHGCRMGCPIGNLALEVSDGNPEARSLIHRNFENWASRVEGWLVEAGGRLPPDVDRARMARFVLTVMEGGLMQSRAANDLGPFDESVAVLREHLNLLLRPAAKRRGDPSGKKRVTGRKGGTRK